MKQNIHPGVFIAVIAAFIVASAIACISAFRTPPADVAKPASGDRDVSRTAVNAAMKEAHGGPTQSERQQIQDWKKSHPGAYTRY